MPITNARQVERAVKLSGSIMPPRFAAIADRFGGDPVKVVCAYHAGQGNVASWLANPLYSPDGVTLETIPTADTAAYCRRVLNARDVYKKYYYPDPTPAPDAVPSAAP